MQYIQNQSNLLWQFIASNSYSPLTLYRQPFLFKTKASNERKKKKKNSPKTLK